MRLPVIYRSENDDSAPIDYSYVASVSEGVRNRQNAPMHEADAPAHRRADPNAHNAISDAPSAPTERASGPRGYEAARRMPRAGDTPAPARIAYPRPRSNDFAAPSAYEPTAPQTLDEAAQVHAARADFSRAQSAAPAAREAVRGVADEWSNLPDATLARQSLPNAQGRAPFADVQSRAQSRQTVSAPRQAPFDNARAAESAMPRRAIGEARQAPAQAAVQPTDVFTADGSQYAAPAKAEVPDWLKTAQQNNAPMSEEFRRRRSPQVQRAPQQAAPPAPMERDMLGRPVRRVAAQAPRAPQSPYEEAGYPPELIAMHRDEERERAEWGARKRHGAQYAQQAPQAGPSARRMPPQAGAPAQRMPSAAPSPDAYAQAPRRREDYAPQGFDRAYRRDDRAPTDAPSTDELYGDGSAQAANRRRSSPANDGGYERRRPAQQGDDPREGRWQDDESDAAPMAKDKPP